MSRGKSGLIRSLVDAFFVGRIKNADLASLRLLGPAYTVYSAVSS
ncbi:hypothetical protein RMSM_03686 [Rhodopirellula maiorica SM1]|uniref:Uncharacterized protein n=1 Tax=Rhodopirellula maiorica SM1 TaxID=1265738 RepID=M5RVH7_9BACT|nr:hypothetical protein RMSM_03686 [Rhodopirellula maiorica SM1]